MIRKSFPQGLLLENGYEYVGVEEIGLRRLAVNFQPSETHKTIELHMERTINNRLNSLRCTIAPFCFLALLISLSFAGDALAVAPDLYVPDDVFGSANVIVLNSGTPQQHNFHVAGDQDWVRFYGLSGVAYSVKASNLGARCDVVLELYDSDGVTRIAGPTDHSTARTNILSAVSMPTSGYCGMPRAD